LVAEQLTKKSFSFILAIELSLIFSIKVPLEQPSTVQLNMIGGPEKAKTEITPKPL
jgi:hypothetical protein